MAAARGVVLWLLALLASSASDHKGAQWLRTSNRLEQEETKAAGERFVTQNNSVVTAQVGASVVLHCKTSSATGGLVSWVRRRDYQLLTVGLHTHSSDDRFSVNYVHWDWQLHVRYVQARDAGVYECQVSSHPPTSLFVHLRVVEAQAEVLGAPEKHVKVGSILRLVCIMHHTTEALSYVFWYRGNEMVNYDSEEGDGGVVVESDDHTSVLMVTSASRLHSGNYTCAPSNTRPASILVHVLNGEYPAAMQHGESGCPGLDPSSLAALVALVQVALALTGPASLITAAAAAAAAVSGSWVVLLPRQKLSQQTAAAEKKRTKLRLLLLLPHRTTAAAAAAAAAAGSGQAHAAAAVAAGTAATGGGIDPTTTVVGVYNNWSGDGSCKCVTTRPQHIDNCCPGCEHYP